MQRDAERWEWKNETKKKKKRRKRWKKCWSLFFELIFGCTCTISIVAFFGQFSLFLLFPRRRLRPLLLCRDFFLSPHAMIITIPTMEFLFSFHSNKIGYLFRFPLLLFLMDLEMSFWNRWKPNRETEKEPTLSWKRECWNFLQIFFQVNKKRLSLFFLFDFFMLRRECLSFIEYVENKKAFQIQKIVKYSF